jgi:hypothetical protein
MMSDDRLERIELRIRHQLSHLGQANAVKRQRIIDERDLLDEVRRLKAELKQQRGQVSVNVHERIEANARAVHEKAAAVVASLEGQ